MPGLNCLCLASHSSSNLCSVCDMEGTVAAKAGQDEFTMGIGKISNSASENPQVAVSVRRISQAEKEVKSLASNYYSGVAKQEGNIGSNGSLDFADNPIVGKLPGRDNSKSDDRPVNRDEINLPDDHSLMSALENLSIDHSISGEPTVQSSVEYNKTSHLHGLWFCGQYHSPGNGFSSMDSADMSVPQTPDPLDGLNMPNQTLHADTPLTLNGIDEFNFRVNCQVAEAAKLNIHELQGQKSESLSGGFRDLWHRASMNTRDAIFMSGLNSSQLASSESFSSSEFGSSTFQHHYCLEKPPTYKLPQDLSYPHIAWDDRHLMMHQKHFYTQQLQNQEVHQLQHGWNSIAQSLTSNPMSSFFGLPVSHQIKQPNQDGYWRVSALERGENKKDLALMGSGSCRYYAQGYCGKENLTFACAKRQTNGSGVRYSGRDFRGVPALNKAGKQTFPEKILTRSKGSKSLRIPDTSPLTSNELANYVGFKQRVPPSGKFYPVVQMSASFQVDGGDSVSISSDNSYNRLASMSPWLKYEYEYDSLDDVVGRIYSLSKEQIGYKFLQETLENCTPQDVHKIFAEITGHIVELTTDPFGNYLLQKLVDICNEDQKMCIIREITSKAGELTRISCDMHGTRVVQKVIEALKTTEQVSMIVSSLKPGIMPLIKDNNGNHVVQYCLQHLSPEFTKFLLDDAISHSVALAKDRQGCVVLQKCLSHFDGQQRERLILDISLNALDLSQHQFGNYVVQYLLELTVPSAMEDVLDKLEGNFAYLSVQKYSSNVVEKCLKCSKEHQCIRIAGELINDPHLLQILQDPYGNYVIQSAIRSCKGTLYDALVEAIRPHIPEIQSNPYGRKVLSTLSRKK